MDDELYLGDGLYASFDGWQIRLRAPRDGGDHEVFLEPDIFEALASFALRCWPIAKSTNETMTAPTVASDPNPS